MRLIDADPLLDDLKESAKAAMEWKEEAQDEEIKIRAEQAHGTFLECALRVKEAPTIEPEVRHGRWILIGRGRITKSRDLKCSVCGNYFRVYDDVTLNAGRGDANFCPNCGAYMREDGGAGNGNG